MTTTTPTIEQTLALAVTFIAIAGVSDSIYALAAGSIGPSLRRASALRSVGRYFSAAMFFGLAAFTAFSGSRSAQ